jgi:hypothetical protein
MGFSSLRRILVKAATYIELASLDCAPPSGFLNLLTVCSALTISALFRAESALGISAFKGFPLPVAATAFTAPALRSPARPPLLRWFVSEEISLCNIGRSFFDSAPKSLLDSRSDSDA